MTRTHSGRPASDHKTRKTLLIANHNDVLAVEGHGEMTVADRKDPYFGPEITLWNETEETQYRVVAVGFARDPELWRAMTNERDYIEGWEFVDNVGLELVEVGDSPQCECGELLQSRNERRMALIGGVCPHD